MNSRTVTQRRRLDGVLLLDKPGGITSQTAVTRVKRLFGAAKAGHTGTLDPMATGLLPVALGEATKFSHTLLDADKSYLATIRLGLTTSTGDLEGEVLGRTPVDVDVTQIHAALARFRGEIMQMPPMYSALKHAGKPLYEYARAGTEVARELRRITIRSLEFLGYEDGELRVAVACSKGTYVRVLAEDLGKALGCGACLAALKRTAVGPFIVGDAVALGALEELTEEARMARLMPVDALLAGLPAFELDREQAQRLRRGQAVDCPHPVGDGLVRVYGPDAAFLGVAESAPPARLLPRRLIAEKAASG